MKQEFRALHNQPNLMTVFVFGNLDLAQDSLPLKILPRLSDSIPEIKFKTVDPNEEWEAEENLTIIDTVINIKEPKVFTDLESFSPSPRLTMHDFDAYTNIKFLKKIGQVKNVKIIGIPPYLRENDALEFLIKTLRSNQP